MQAYKRRQVQGKFKRVHVLIAEAALGHKLQPGAEVHHINEDKFDNRNENLVICPSRAYHSLLHQRMRALEVCGNANWRKCVYCKKYSPVDQLRPVTTKCMGHAVCRYEYGKEVGRRTSERRRVRDRIRAGWSVEQASTVPIMRVRTRDSNGRLRKEVES